MAAIKKNTSIREVQSFVQEVYGLPNDRYFSIGDMLTNIERFTMRGLKGIRKNDIDRTKLNIIIAYSWFSSIMNHLHIDLETEVWKRFPHICSYCGNCPCACKAKKIQKRGIALKNNNKPPKTLSEFQAMFEKIYPSKERTIEQAGVHLAEEIGEFSEALLISRGLHRDVDFKNVELEAADYFSCIISVFNSLHIDLATELSKIFSNNCHKCHNAPCDCNFNSIVHFNS
jgi:NTP pyrophosphatase (non-canonical NTP hydrolase)